MKTYDWYLHKDLAEDLKKPDLTDCELIVHGGLLAENLRNISGKEAKNEIKRTLAMKIKNTMPNYPQLGFSGDLTVPTRYSVALRFSWVLQTPFFSRAVDEFGTIDNPITRDTLTNLPVLHASGAKGMLRGLLHNELDEDELRELFGNDREIKNQDDAYAGIVIPGDVVFNGKTKTEVFSPHVRATRTADHPVSFEVVPAGVSAQWDILVFDFRNRQKKIFPLAAKIIRSVNLLVTGIGLSAKRTSGLGLGRDLIVEIKTDKAFPVPAGKLPVDKAASFMEGLK